MSHITLFSHSDIDEVTSHTTQKINELLKNNLNNEILFLVSGGSAFKLLDKIDNLLLGNHITVSMLDERYSEDTTINNFSQLKETYFYKDATDKHVRFIDTSKITKFSLLDSSLMYETALRMWKKDYPNGIVIATQGIGEDGHTSGIMPQPEDKTGFETTYMNDTWVVGYDAGKKNQYPLRITTSITFLKDMIDESVVFAVGDKKKEPLLNIFKPGHIAEVPARIIKEMKSVYLFTTTSLPYNKKEHRIK